VEYTHRFRFSTTLLMIAPQSLTVTVWALGVAEVPFSLESEGPGALVLHYAPPGYESEGVRPDPDAD